MTNSLLHNVVWVISDAGVKAAVLLALAGLACLVLRRASAAVRHQIWSLAFCGAVLLPIVSSIIPQWRIPVLPAPQPASPEPTAPPAAIEEMTPIAAAPAIDETAPPTPFPPAREEWISDREMMPGFGDRPIAQAPTPPTLVNEDAPAALSESLVEPPETAATASSWTIGDIATPVACFWLAGFVLVMAPFAAGAAVTWRLVRRARQMTDADATELVQSHAQRLGVARRVSLVETECSLVPMTVGILKPLVVLPADWRNWPAERVRFVLLHELAHIRRLDVMYQGIGRLACGLYWFNPLAWYALRRLRIERELACDDCVIAVGETASAYAGQLLEIARAYRPARLAVGIAITRSSKLEERIVSLFDRARPHLPVSRRIALSLATLAALLVLCLSIVRFTSGETVLDADAIDEADDPADTSATTLAASSTEKPAADATAPTAPEDDDTRFTYAGTVVDERGQPVAGAKIALTYRRRGDLATDALSVAVTDQQGKFAFSRRKSEFADSQTGLAWINAGLVATKDGTGFAFGPSAWFETSGRLDAEMTDEQRQGIEMAMTGVAQKATKTSQVLVLVPDDMPIRGRILDTEGQPVRGVKVEAVNVWGGTDGTLDAWETAMAARGADFANFGRHLSSLTLTSFSRSNANFFMEPRAIAVPETRTDADGRFTLTGIGRERVVELFVSGATIQTMLVRARSRRGEIVTVLREGANPGLGSERIYPAEFTCVAGPSAPVEGRVTDSKTGKPLPGLVVRASKIATDYIHGSLAAIYIRTVTDADGRYQLNGLPPGRNTIQVVPPIGSQYLTGAARVTTTAAAKPLVKDIPLTAGVLVRGRTTDARTGKPVQGSVQYYALTANPNWQDVAGFRDSDPGDHYCRTDAQGRFEVPVLPGQGILAFDADNWADYPRGAGADEIDAPREKQTNFSYFNTEPHLCVPKDHHLVSLIDPAAGTDELAINLSLNPGKTFPCRVVVADSGPLGEFYVFGETASHTSWTRHEGESFEIKGYLPREGRRAMVYHPDRNLVGLVEKTGAAPAALEVTLRPGATITGRIVDADGVPLENVSVGTHWGALEPQAMLFPGSAKSRGVLTTHPDGPYIRTDDQGRFEFKGIIPGLTYSASAAAPDKSVAPALISLGTIFTDVTAEPGETKDLGDLRPRPDAARKPEIEQLKSPDQAVASPDTSSSAKSGKANEDLAYVFTGTVVDPDGKPVVGAIIKLSNQRRTSRAGDEAPAAISDESGRFTFSRKETDFAEAFGWIPRTRIVAAKEGFGFASGLAAHFETTGQIDASLSEEARQRIEQNAGKKTSVLTLIRDDVPVRGRILNTEGRPIAGARIHLYTIAEGNDGSLDAWEAAAKGENAEEATTRRHLRYIFQDPGRGLVNQTMPPVFTDADGWFTLKGIGRERIVHSFVSGPGIESTNLQMRSRAGEVLTVPRSIRNPGFGSETYYPREFTRVVGPSVAVEGRVTDDKTGQPLAGIHVRARAQASENGLSGPIVLHIYASTSADGKFRLEGLPTGKNSFYVIPAKDSRYLPGAADVETSAGSPPVVRDVTLTAGVLVRGQATDGRTGQPLRGTLQYFAYQTNPHLQQAVAFSKADLHQFDLATSIQSDAEGRFEIPVLPGPGILGFSAGQQYPRGVGVEAIDCPRLDGLPDHFKTLPNYCRAGSFNLVVPLNPQPDDDELTINLTVRAGAKVVGRVLSPEGQPLSNYYIAGDSMPEIWRQNRPEEFAINGYLPTDERRLMFYHPERDLVGLYDLTGPPPKRLDVTLRPGGTLVGRVLDADGQPMDGVWLVSYSRMESAPGVRVDAIKDRGLLLTRFETHEIRTDRNGRFELKGIIPGLKYSAYVAAPRKIGNFTASVVLGTIFRDVTAEPGETKNLGDVKPLPDKPATGTKPKVAEPKAPHQAAALTNTSAPADPGKAKDDDTTTLRGHVLDPNGKPFAGAKVYVLGMYGGNLISGVKNVPLAESKSRADGSYEISWSKSDFERANWGVGFVESLTTIAVFAEGFGPAWKPISDLARKDLVTLQLVPDDVPVTGRVVDLEGRPIAGVKVSVRRLRAPKEGDLTAWLEAVGAGEMRLLAIDRLMTYLPDCEAAGITGALTDAQGKFRISGIGRDRYAELVLEGENIAYSEASLVTRRIAPLEMKEADTPPQIPRITRQLYGSEFDFAALPSRPVTGIVRDAETGKGIAGARVFSWQFAGNRVSAQVRISTPTDEAGRFRLTGMPEGKGSRILVMPAANQPWFSQVVEVAVNANLDPSPCDIQLHRGIWLTGKVTDKATGAPVSARVDWVPFRSNEFARKLTQEFDASGRSQTQTDYRTQPDGTFRVVALPGRGVVAAQATSHLSYRYGAGGEKIEIMSGARRGPPGMLPAGVYIVAGGMLRYHSLKEVDVPAGAQSFASDLELDPGASVRVSVVDPDGKPITSFTANAQQTNIRSQVNSPTFEIRNLVVGEKRPVLIYSEARQLGKAMLVDFVENAPKELTINLEPCASIKGQVVSPDGDSMAGATLHIQALTTDRPTPRLDLARQPLDKEGRFRFAGLLPGCDYILAVQGGGIGGYVSERLSIKPGETIDLGTVTVKPVQDGPQSVPANPAASEKTEPRSEAKSVNSNDRVTIRGRVLTPDGKPAGGATVRAAAPMYAMMKPILGESFEPPMSEVTADQGGSFSISFPTQPFGDVSRLEDRWQEIWKETAIAASLKGYGPVWVRYNELDPKQPLTLRLVEDMPIRGRVVDLEGRPVAGTTVKVGEPHSSKGDDISAWLAGVKAGELPWTVVDKAPRSVEPRLVGTPTAVTTNAKGEFEIRGLGRERIVELTFAGETVAHREASAVTRAMEPIRRTINGPPFEGSEPVFGANFTFTADPARTIEGTVRDAKTREVLAGVSVESYKLVGYPFSNNRVLKATTDREGQFRLIGMPKGAGNKLLLVPNDDQPYFMRRVDVPDPVGLGPAKMEIELHRGIMIAGQVTDKATGAPVHGVRMHYLPFRSNSFAQVTPEFDANGNVDGDQMRYVTKNDGTYRLVGLPGRAIVGAESVMQDYRSGVGYAEIDAPKIEESGYFDTYRNPIYPGPKWPSAMREINPPADAKGVSLDLQLDPGAPVRIRVVDADDIPLIGVSVDGKSAHGSSHVSKEPVLTATNFGPGESRTILFHHREKNLGRVVTIGPDEVRGGEVTVKLQPCATVVGRILNEDAKSASGMALRPWVLPSDDFGNRLPDLATDADGRFRATLLPGCRYHFTGEGGGFENLVIVEELAIEPGETKDLGTLTFDREGKLMRPDSVTKPKTDEGAARSPAKSGQRRDEVVVTGVVRMRDGKPAARAHVAAIGRLRRPERGGDLLADSDILAETLTDGNGRFQVKLSGVSSKTHSETNLVARSENTGLAWRRLDLDAGDSETPLELPAEELIRGRLIDIEGRPAAGVLMRVASIVATAPKVASGDGPGYRDFEKPPRAWPQNVTTDDEGRFTLHNIPAGHGVYMSVEGSDRFAPQSLSINTGAPEQRGEKDATYRSLVKNAKPGDEVVIALAPAQIFEGAVRYADTGQPAPYARLTIWASQQAVSGSMFSVPGKADAQGRYRLNPHPGVRFGITAYPPDGVPYLIRQVRDITWKDGASVKQVDVTLPRGVLVRGRVIETKSNTPVPGAAIQYVPESRNSSNADDIVTRWQGIQLSGGDGEFEIAVLPGPGTLLANGPQGQFIFKEFGSRQLESGLPGGWRQYAHAIHRVNPEKGSGPIDVTLEMQRGTTVVGRITNEAGEPVAKALVITPLSINPSETEWRFPLETFGGRFELSGLAEGREYPVHFLDAKNRLGATVMLTSDNPTPTVVLAPCGQATATFTDAKGKPLADHYAPLEIVVTPGPHKFESAVMSGGALAADSGHNANIDRTNYWDGPLTDADGRITMPALIPGARYRIITFEKGLAIVLKEFVAESGKTLDLGKIAFRHENPE